MIDREALALRLDAVRGRIGRAARAVGRDPAEVSLLAVTKTWPAEVVEVAYGLGLRDFGENYAAEVCAKAEALRGLEGIRWHFIGHLQRNKARSVAGVAHAVQSVDSVRLAEALGERAAEAGRSLGCWVQVNVGGEAQKSGCAPGEAAAVAAAVEGQRALRLEGLMTVPPHTDDPAGAGVFFAALVALRESLGGGARLPGLSMGMTHDLEVAVAAGATVVRVGSALFGDRGVGRGG